MKIIIELTNLLSSIDAFCGRIDEINEVRVIGCEPFMNKDIYAILKKLIELHNILKVLIFTNGTLLNDPNDLINYLFEKCFQKYLTRQVFSF